MSDEAVKVLESAAERYAEDVCQEVEKSVFLTPPERENYRELISNAYFCGAYELWEVLKESNNPTNKTPR